MTNSRYEAIDAWDELISKLYGEDGKRKIEILIERMELGLISWNPKWTILLGKSGTGKSTLIHILIQLFPDQWIAVAGYKPCDYGQYDNILGICPDGDVSTMYNYINRNWTVSSRYHLLVATNKEPSVELQNSDMIIRTTGNRVLVDEYRELITDVLAGIPELKLYFREKAGRDYIERRL